jgi:hypothetical protein
MPTQTRRPPRTLDEAVKKRGELRRLARKLGISITYLCELREGRRQPNLALAKETHVPLASLVRRAA